MLGSLLCGSLCGPAPASSQTESHAHNNRQANSVVLADFDGNGSWSGGELDSSLHVEGTASRMWTPSNGSLKLNESFNFWNYDGLRFWLHSNTSEREEFLIYLQSEDGTNESGSYYSHKVLVDWTGWRQVEVPFHDFKGSRTPLGFHLISSVRFYADGWGMTSNPDVVLHFDALEAYGPSTPPTIAPPGPFAPSLQSFDWKYGAVHATTWHKLLENNDFDQQFPSRIDVVGWPLYAPDTRSLRYRVHAGEDLSGFETSLATNMRAENHTNAGAYGAEMGDEVWWRFTYRFEKLDRKRPMTLWQWRSQRKGVTGGPGVELKFNPTSDGRFEIIGAGWAVEDNDRGVLVNDTVENRWYDFVCMIRYSTNNGQAKCWVDQVLKWDYAGPTVESSSHDDPHIRNGLYRWAAPDAFEDGEILPEDQEMISFQGPTAYSINPASGHSLMEAAFPSVLHFDPLETSSLDEWSRSQK